MFLIGESSLLGSDIYLRRGGSLFAGLYLSVCLTVIKITGKVIYLRGPEHSVSETLSVLQSWHEDFVLDLSGCFQVEK